jgi:hypothetical protein
MNQEQIDPPDSIDAKPSLQIGHNHPLAKAKTNKKIVIRDSVKTSQGRRSLYEPITPQTVQKPKFLIHQAESPPTHNRAKSKMNQSF